MTEADIRQAVKDAGVKLLQSNLVQGTWGNISIRLDDKHMVVTPSGLDYIRLKPSDMVVVDIDTLEYNSPIKPTSEKKIHAAIYRERKDVNAIIHSHPLWCSSVAAARRELPAFNDSIKETLGGCVRVGEYGMPSTKTLTQATVEALKDRNACFMANHGIIACADSIEKAFEICKLMEQSSETFVQNETKRLTGKDSFDAKDVEEAYLIARNN